MKLVWLPRAIANRTEQLEYIAKESPKAAIDQGDLIRVQVRQLIEFPEMGRVGRVGGTRELVITQTPFIVIYRIRPQAKRVELMRVFYTSQQWPPQPMISAASRTRIRRSQ